MARKALSIGFIGLGNMGLPMAQRLRDAGHDLFVWNRDQSKTAILAKSGATVCTRPAEVLREADIIALCVTDHHAVESVCFGDEGLSSVGSIAAGKLIVDFSSIDPEACIAIAQRMRDSTGVRWIDAPVSGGVPAAEAGTLIVFAGGDAADVAAAQPVFDAVSKRVTHMGPTGSGQATKVCNQMIVSATVMVLAETYATARHAGLDVDRLAAALEGGFADSKPLQIFGPRMAARNYTPRQTAISIMAKDTVLGQKLAAKAGVATPVSALAAALYRAIHARSDVDFDGDISELVELYEPKK